MRDRAYWAKLLPVITALVNGKECQYRYSVHEDWQRLIPINPIAWYEDVEYRIKPETLQYRRFLYAIDKQTYIGICHNVAGAISPKQREDIEFFIKWIDTEWQEIELPSSTETGG